VREREREREREACVHRGGGATQHHARPNCIGRWGEIRTRTVSFRHQAHHLQHPTDHTMTRRHRVTQRQQHQRRTKLCDLSERDATAEHAIHVLHEGDDVPRLALLLLTTQRGGASATRCLYYSRSTAAQTNARRYVQHTFNNSPHRT
jgi:hypothetical protein